MTCCDVAVYRQEVRYIRDTEWGRERSLEGHHTKTSQFSAPFFNKIKNEKLSERVYRFKVLLFIKKMENRYLLATLAIFSIFLIGR